MPNKLKDPCRHKFKKAKYRTINSKEYNQALKSRGSLTLWMSEDAITKWNPPLLLKKKRGGQLIYTDFAITTCLTLGLVYKQRLHQTEGLVESIIKLMNVHLAIPNFSTISRRSKRIKIRQPMRRPDENLVVAIDSTGLKIYGEQEWQVEKYKIKTRKSWRKLHLAIDENGNILGSELTLHNVGDSSILPRLLDQIDHPITTILADGAYDQPSTYKAMDKHQKSFANAVAINAAIPPNLGFRSAKDTDSQLRLDNIRIIEQGGAVANSKIG